MILFELIFLMFISLAIAYNEIVLKHYNNFASSTFIIIYIITFIIIPIVLHACFGGAQRVDKQINSLHLVTEQYHLVNFYGLIILLPMIYLSFCERATGTEIYQGLDRRVEFNQVFRRLAYVVPVLGLIIFIISTGMSILQLFSSGRFSWYASPSVNLFMIAISHYFFAFMPVSIFLYILERRKVLMDRILLVAMVFSALFYAAISYDRKWVFYLLSSTIGAYYYLSGYQIKIRFKWLIFGTILFVFIFFSQFFRDYLLRYMTNTLNSKTTFFDEISLWLERLIVSGDISYFYRASCELIYFTIEKGIISPGAFILRNILFFLPSGSSLGIKPPDVAATFSVLVNGGSSLREGDMPPGLFGIIVASFGLYFSTIVFFLFPLALRKIDILIKEGLNITNIVFMSSFISLLLFFTRGDDSSGIYFFISSFAFLQFISFFARCRVKL